MTKIAALFVQPDGVYYGLPDVDPWDEVRDARGYRGPHPVVAHPPCARWSVLAPVVEAKGGPKRGQDDGCFAAALGAVRRWGGVLEHPAETLAWRVFDLPRPMRAGWIRGLCGGWSCAVAQGAYGHRATKMTWLYYFGTSAPPLLDWSRPAGVMPVQSMSGTGRERSRTPIAFRDTLIAIARSAQTVCPVSRSC